MKSSVPIVTSSRKVTRHQTPAVTNTFNCFFLYVWVPSNWRSYSFFHLSFFKNFSIVIIVKCLFFKFQKRLPRHGDISIALNNELREIQLKFGSKRNLKKKVWRFFSNEWEWRLIMQWQPNLYKKRETATDKKMWWKMRLTHFDELKKKKNFYYFFFYIGNDALVYS